MKPVSRVMIAGTHSGVSKTTIATPLMAGFTCRGYRIQGFKTGLDFILVAGFSKQSVILHSS